jgi:hypothetical protein
MDRAKTTIGLLAAPGLLLLSFACGGGGTPPAQNPPQATASATTPPPPVTASAADAGGTAAGEGDAAPPAPATDSSPHKVANVQTATPAIAVDDSAVYYIDLGDGSLNSVAPGGGTRTTLFSSPGTVMGVPYLTQDSGVLYFAWRVQPDTGATDGKVFRFEKGGDQPQPLASGVKDDFTGIAVDPTNVYYSSGSTIYRVPLKGGPMPQAASGSGNGPTSVALDTTTIFWTTDGTIFKSSKDHSAPQLVASGQPHSTNIQIDGDNVYWVASGTKLMKGTKAGGAATEVVQADGPIADYAIDGGTIWFATANAIMKVAATGGAATKVCDANNPLGIAFDGATLYWAAKGTDAHQFKDGAIMAKSK